MSLRTINEAYKLGAYRLPDGTVVRLSAEDVDGPYGLLIEPVEDAKAAGAPANKARQAPANKSA